MEVLEVSGYVSEEKSVIAEKYLGPQAREASGLQEADVVLDSEAIDVLIKYYCRESGVRNLKKHIDKVSSTTFGPHIKRRIDWRCPCSDLPQSCFENRSRSR